jgi:uncharacterized protein
VERRKPGAQGHSARPQREGATFVADGMLGSLSRKLRAFGFDTLYAQGWDDPRLQKFVSRSGRVLLTSDRALWRAVQSHGGIAVLVTGRTDANRLSEVRDELRKAGVPLNPGSPRCSLCNSPLRRLTGNEADAFAPPVASKRHRLFLGCPRCGKVYWRGSHWKKLRRLEREFTKKETLVRH